MYKKKPRVKKVQSRMEHGFCKCSKSCTGISLEIASSEQVRCATCTGGIAIGDICLYLHAQRGTMGAQSNRHHIACAQGWVPQTTPDLRHRQKCAVCDLSPESSFHRVALGSTKMTVHNACLQKMIALTQEQMLDICAKSINPTTVNLSYTKMAPKQLKKYKIPEDKIKKIKTNLEKNIRTGILTPEDFDTWLQKSAIETESSEWSSQIIFHGKIHRKNVKLHISVYKNNWESAANYYSRLRDTDDALNLTENRILHFYVTTQSGKQSICTRLEKETKKFFNNLETLLDFCCKKKYNLPFKDSYALLLTEEHFLLRSLANLHFSEKNNA